MAASPAGAELGLNVIEDEDNGYSVQIMYGTQPLAQHDGGGEFSLVVENADRSYHQIVKGWKASSYREDDDTIELSGRISLGNLIANLDVRVVYEKINRHVVKKQVHIVQNNARRFFYSLENRLEPLEIPADYWSFNQESCRGGSLLEYFPAAGFRLKNGVACGLLTDAGHRNLWTRNVRKRSVVGSFDVSGFAAVKTMPDRDLVTVSKPSERDRGDHFVALNFGQVFNFNQGSSRDVALPSPDAWVSLEGGTLKLAGKKKDTQSGPNGGANGENREGHAFTIAGSADKNSLSGSIIPIPVKPGLFYDVSFRYRSNVPTMATRLWAAEETHDISLYNDRLKASKANWSTFSQQFYVTDIKEEEGIHRLVLSKGYGETAPDYRLEVKDFRVTEHYPVVECYHPLDMAETSVKTMFIFAEPASTLRDYRLASQVRLAEGLGFKGNQVEKILFADLNMLTWISDAGDLTPHMVPSLNYSPDMYNRDSFWSAIALYDRELNEAIWNKWAATQNTDGGIGTIITPLVGSEEFTPNDATLCFILWAFVNKKRFNSRPDMEKVEKALAYCRENFPLDDEGRIQATTPLCQMDVMWTHDQRQVYAVNQGMWAVVLRCAKELGCRVTDDEISKAQAAYRSMYDNERGHIISWTKRPDIIALYDMMPEFLSWWFWDEPILTAEAVINTLEKFPVYNDCLPIMCKDDGTFFVESDHPYDVPEIRWHAGIYYNGGSWMRVEYLAYVAALKHGWPHAKDRMHKRLLADINNKPDEPLSHEWMPCKPGVEWNMSKVFAWNAFIIIANEVAGLR